MKGKVKKLKKAKVCESATLTSGSDVELRYTTDRVTRDLCVTMIIA